MYIRCVCIIAHLFTVAGLCCFATNRFRYFCSKKAGKYVLTSILLFPVHELGTTD